MLPPALAAWRYYRCFWSWERAAEGSVRRRAGVWGAREGAEVEQQLQAFRWRTFGGGR